MTDRAEEEIGELYPGLSTRDLERINMSEMSTRTSPSLRTRALASVAAVAIVASGALGVTFVGQHAAVAESRPLTVESATAPASFADIVDKVKPAVVSVKVVVGNSTLR